jgi:hypothetical protein
LKEETLDLPLWKPRFRRNYGRLRNNEDDVTALDCFFIIFRCNCGACNWSPGSSVSNYKIILTTADAKAATATRLILLTLRI